MEGGVQSKEQPPAVYFLAPGDPEWAERGYFTPIKFEQPADRSSAIWRYMTIGKFLSILDKRSLFFARLDTLGDPFEGAITRHQQELRDQLEKRSRMAVLRSTSPEMIESRMKNTIVNCWHMRDHESMPMWERYVKGNEGIAIRSSYERLVSSFHKFDGREQRTNEDRTDLYLFVRIGMVKYIDFETYDGPIEELCLLKRLGFEDEHEVRAVVLDRSFMGDPHPTRFPTGGDYVPVDLTELIEAIYVAPKVPPWFRRTVESLVNRYGFGFPVKQSKLDSEPIR